MFALSKSACALAALVPAVLVGCYSSPYQSGYGYPGYNYPGGTVPLQGGQGYSPPSNDGNLGKPAIPNGKSGTNNNGTNSGGGNATNNLVPNYNDPPNSRKTPEKTGGNTDSTFKFKASGSGSSDNKTGAQDGKKLTTPFKPGGANNVRQAGQKILLTGGESGNGTPFRGAPEPKRFQLPETAKKLPAKHNGPSDEQLIGQPQSPPSPYDYDAKKYTWLRGTIEYDEKIKSWKLMYSEKPTDKYGGVLTLIDDSRKSKLDVLRSGDVVLVEGKLESAATDGKKPKYRITELFGPLVPKAQIPKPGQVESTSNGKSQVSRNSTKESPVRFFSGVTR